MSTAQEMYREQYGEYANWCLGVIGLINKCMLKAAIFYSYYLFTNTLFYLAGCSFNGYQKYVYEKLVDTVLWIVLVKTAVQE